MSVAFYTPSRLHVLSRQHWKMLKPAGFPVKEFWKEHRPHLLLSAVRNECNSDDDDECLDYDAVACVSEIVALEQAKGHEAISQS